MKKILNFINGEFCEPQSEKYVNKINPATGQIESLIADSNEADVHAAIDSAGRAFQSWKKSSFEERAQYLRKMAEAIMLRADEFAVAESIDCGKPLQLAKKIEIPRSAHNLQFFADSLTHFHGESFQTNATTSNQTEYTPLGVVGCISPWNLPLYLLTWKIAPALAAGNTVVAKPSELSPTTAFLLSEVARDVKLPHGVLNILHGFGPSVGAPMVVHPQVKAISFTGSTATGRSIAQAAAGQFKKLALEMGGKNPNIIFADCDFDKALETTVRSSFQNQGQICLCGSRIFIERPLYEKFKLALIDKTKNLRLGNPLDMKTEQGALISESHLQKVLSYIDLAKTEGAKILTGGKRAHPQGEFAFGFFVEPTLIENLPYDCRTNQEEIFGPVATLMPFDRESEVITMANSTKYGLAASVWTTDIAKARRISHSLEAGVVWVNTWMNRDLRTPFGGVKESGFGREGGLEALRFFSEVKNVCTQTDLEANHE